MAFAHYCLNNEELDIKDLLPATYRAEAALSRWDDPRDLYRVHDSRSYENTLLALIQAGQCEKLKLFLERQPFTGTVGTLASETLRQHQNLNIVSAALASRAAVAGGLDYETAMTMSDNYIQKIELVHNLESLTDLFHSMLMAYAQKTADAQINNSVSALAAKVRNYIEQHISSDIKTTAIADKLNMNRSYLSRRFREETGIKLNDFINRLKINEAMRLLSSTGQRLDDIASLLSFSSPSYFSLLFKKQTGKTPLEYRRARR
jgi:YesN/AraC family two-component response regulator